MFLLGDRRFEEEASNADRYLAEASRALELGDACATVAAYKSGRQSLEVLKTYRRSLKQELRYTELGLQVDLMGSQALNLLMGRIIEESGSVMNRFNQSTAVYNSIAQSTLSVQDVSIEEALAERREKQQEVDARRKKELYEIQQGIAGAMEDADLAMKIVELISEGGPQSGSLGIAAENIRASRQELATLSKSINQMRSLLEGKDAD